MRRRKTRPQKAKKILFVIFAALCVGIMLFSLVQILTIWEQRGEAGEEYSRLRLVRSAPAQPESAAEPAMGPAALSEINPDYAGWLTVEGAKVDYPVARGADNRKYLNTTFGGSYNPAGAIFMDCANEKDFTSPHTIIYGHNMKDGTMFGGLFEYLNDEFLQKNPVVTVALPDGGMLTYHIFAAKKIWEDDALYDVTFSGEEEFAAFFQMLGAPGAVKPVLTLSTCTNGDDDERMVVHAVLRG